MAKLKYMTIFCENLEKEVITPISECSFYYDEDNHDPLLDNEIRCEVNCDCGETHNILVTYL